MSENIIQGDTLISEIIEYKVNEESSTDDNEWIEFILKMPETSIYFHPQWLKILEEETNQKIIRLVSRDNSGQIVGVLAFQFTKGFPLGIGGVLGTKRLASLPRTPISGLIACNNEVSDMLLRKAIEISIKYTRHTLQIKSFSNILNDGIPELSKRYWRSFYITSIPKYPEVIKFRNSDNHAAIKRAVNKAIKNGVKLRYSDSSKDLLVWYSLYLDTMKFHTTPPRSFRFFTSLWNNLKPLGIIQLLLAEIENNGEHRVIAGSIFLNFNKTVVYAFNGSNRKDFELRPNDLIHWTAIHDAQKNGFEFYDLGEVTKGQAGLEAYKQKWGSKKIDMYHYYFPNIQSKKKIDIDSGNNKGFLKHIWNFVPNKITSLIGSQFYKRL